ncbi:hypothetical protein WJX79_007817 [Trebouxia sp. C0005]
MLSRRYPFGLDDPADWQDPANHTTESEIAYVVSHQTGWMVAQSKKGAASNDESTHQEDAVTMPAQAAELGTPIMTSEIPSKTPPEGVIPRSTPESPGNLPSASNGQLLRLQGAEEGGTVHHKGPGPVIIVTRLAEGITLEAAMALLWRERDTSAGMQKYKKAVKLIWRQVIQGARALHCCGRSHTDLKPRNIHVYNWDDPSSLEVTILDLGSSVVQGQWNKRDWPAASTYFSSPEMLAAMSGLMQKGRYRKHLDFLAHDMWSLGLSGLML